MVFRSLFLSAYDFVRMNLCNLMFFFILSTTCLVFIHLLPYQTFLLLWTSSSLFLMSCIFSPFKICASVDSVLSQGVKTGFELIKK